MTAPALYQLPDEVFLSILNHRFPCREQQIQALATLLDPHAAPCKNCLVYGTEATGKSAIVASLLRSLSDPNQHSHHDGTRHDGTHLGYAIVSSTECITGRHLFERTVGAVAKALGWESPAPRCESLSALTVELSRMLTYTQRPAGWCFVLVFDAIDRQREAPLTLLPALARLSEIIPCLTTVFIVTSPPPNFLRTPFVTQVHFPNYTKPEFVKILSAAPPPKTLPNTTDQETADLWVRFATAVHDALTKSAVRTLPAFQRACHALWRRFTAPIRDGTLGPRDFSKLLVAARAHFRDESLLDPGIIAVCRREPDGTTTSMTSNHSATTPSSSALNSLGPHSKATAAATATAATTTTTTTTSLATLLPTTARILLMAAYLASHNATRHDLTLFSTYHHGRRRRRGGGLSVSGGGAAGRRGPRSKHRKIARKLLGPHAFVLERMLAIFVAVRGEWAEDSGYHEGGQAGGAAFDADVGMALATLSSLRLLVRVGAGADVLDRGGKWRVNVGWEVVRALGRSVGIEVEEWLID